MRETSHFQNKENLDKTYVSIIFYRESFRIQEKRLRMKYTIFPLACQIGFLCFQTKMFISRVCISGRQKDSRRSTYTFSPNLLRSQPAAGLAPFLKASSSLYCVETQPIRHYGTECEAVAPHSQLYLHYDDDDDGNEEEKMSYCPYSEWEVEGGNFYLLLMELGQQLLLFYALVASLLHSSVGQWGMLAWLS